MRPRIAVIGAGNVGATAAQRILETELADVVLIDIVDGLPQGKALDMMESAPVLGCDATVIGSNDMSGVAGCDLVIVTAGLARKPGMSRDDLLAKNASIIRGISGSIRDHAPGAFVIVVTNPLDVMTAVAYQETGFARERVIGMAGALDSARLRSFIAMELGCSVREVSAMVLGGHGDSMVPLPRYCTVSGICLPRLMSAERIEALAERTRQGGAEIVALLKTGSAYYAPSASAVAMAASILRDQKQILPSCTLLDGEYGLNGVFVGVPVRLGAGGVEEIIELDLTDAERAALDASAGHVRQNMAKAGVSLGTS